MATTNNEQPQTGDSDLRGCPINGMLGSGLARAECCRVDARGGGCFKDGKGADIGGHKFS